jgi:hypothetical protein
MATKAQTDKIRSMVEKGTITSEQAEELFQALRDEPGVDDRVETVETEDDRAGADAGSRKEERMDRGEERRHGRRPGWIRDMVEEIKAGIGSSFDFYDPETGRYTYNYRYEYDPKRAWKRKLGNAQSLSHVDHPEGEDYEFKDNAFTFSKLSLIRLDHSRMNNNRFAASTIRDITIEGG